MLLISSEWANFSGKKWPYTSATICFLSRSLILSKLSSLRANTLRKDRQGATSDRGGCSGDTYNAIRFPSNFTNNTKGSITNDVQRFIRI